MQKIFGILFALIMLSALPLNAQNLDWNKEITEALKPVLALRGAGYYLLLPVEVGNLGFLSHCDAGAKRVTMFITANDTNYIYEYKDCCVYHLENNYANWQISQCELRASRDKGETFQNCDRSNDYCYSLMWPLLTPEAINF